MLFDYREDVEVTADQFIWKQEIEDEIEELREEHEREYKRKLLTHEEEMARYQKQQQAKVCRFQKYLRSFKWQSFLAVNKRKFWKKICGIKENTIVIIKKDMSENNRNIMKISNL